MSFCRFVIPAAAGLVVVAGFASARPVIKEPGAHPDYTVELEPHALLDWADVPGPNGEGFGLGLRVSIPFLDNGPIDTINDNMAIGFGMDWVHRRRGCRHRDPWWDNCRVDSLWFPVVLQWNFFLTDVISVFGEPGIALVHHRWETWDHCAELEPCAVTDTGVRPAFWGGARFLFTDTVGITVRIGHPSLTAGVSLLF